MNKKKAITQHLAETYSLFPKSKHQRITSKLANRLETDVYNFYLRDDISYQLPDKRHRIVVKEDNGTRVTYQKRILLSNRPERTPPDKVRKIIFFGDFSHIASVKERIFLHMFLNLI